MFRSAPSPRAVWTTAAAPPLPLHHRTVTIEVFLQPNSGGVTPCSEALTDSAVGFSQPVPPRETPTLTPPFTMHAQCGIGALCYSTSRETTGPHGQGPLLVHLWTSSTQRRAWHVVSTPVHLLMRVDPFLPRETAELGERPQVTPAPTRARVPHPLGTQVLHSFSESQRSCGTRPSLELRAKTPTGGLVQCLHFADVETEARRGPVPQNTTWSPSLQASVLLHE